MAKTRQFFVKAFPLIDFGGRVAFNFGPDEIPPLGLSEAKWLRYRRLGRRRRRCRRRRRQGGVVVGASPREDPLSREKCLVIAIDSWVALLGE